MMSGCAASSVRMLGPPGKKIPQVTGQNLHRDRVRFPEDIKGRPTLLLIAFRHEQQRDIDTWLSRLDELQGAAPDLKVLELPVLGRAYVIMRPVIDGGMRSGIPDPDARARTVTLYTNKRSFRKALGLGPEDRIYAVLVSQTAEILQVEEGPASDESINAIIDKCSSLGAGALFSKSEDAGAAVDATRAPGD
jgi:hypothetical protein